MRWWAVALAAGLLALVPGAVDARGSTCSSRGSETIAENAVARVYLDRGDDTFSCSKANGRRNMIAHESYDLIQHLTLRGHHVAFSRRSCETSGFECAEGVHVFDVRHDEEAGFFSSGWIATVVLRSNGSIAWGEHDLDPRYEDERESLGVIYRHTRRGTTRLDRSHVVDPESLRLTGRKLSWRHGGTLRRATLR